MVRAKKQKKDPLAPKGPLSSFLEFGKVERSKILSDLGSLPLVEVGKELRRRWKLLDQETKMVYEKKAGENRARYKQEMLEYSLREKTTAPSRNPAEALGNSDGEQSSKKIDVSDLIEEIITKLTTSNAEVAPTNPDVPAPSTIVPAPSTTVARRCETNNPCVTHCKRRLDNSALSHDVFPHTCYTVK